jgi:hypothetical protein
MKVAPYTPEEIEAVLAFKNPGRIKRGRCDWCGEALSPIQPKSAYICYRCWENRLAIRAAIADCNSVAHSSEPVCEDAPDTCTTQPGHRGRSA